MSNNPIAFIGTKSELRRMMIHQDSTEIVVIDPNSYFSRENVAGRYFSAIIISDYSGIVPGYSELLKMVKSRIR